MSNGLKALKDISWQFDLSEKAQDEYKIVEKELKALKLLKNIPFDIVYQEQFDEWTLFIIYETDDGSQLVPILFGSGREEYDLLGEALL